MTRAHSADEVPPVDSVLGDDGDAPGISQELTIDDIDDVALDANLSVDDRREELLNLLAELRSRRASDLMGDMQQVVSHLEDRLASLRNPLESQTILESTGMDADSRSDDDDPADHVDDEDEDLRVADLSPKRI